MSTMISRCTGEFKSTSKVAATDHLHADIDVAVSKYSKGIFIAQCHGYVAMPKEQAIELIKHLEKAIEQI